MVYFLLSLSILLYGTCAPVPVPLTNTITKSSLSDTLPPIDSTTALFPSSRPVVLRYVWGTQSIIALGEMVINRVPYEVQYIFRRIEVADGWRGRHLWVWMSETDTLAYEEDRGVEAHPYLREGVVYWNNGRLQFSAQSIAADWARWGKREMICGDGEDTYCLFFWGNPYDEQALD